MWNLIDVMEKALFLGICKFPHRMCIIKIMTDSLQNKINQYRTEKGVTQEFLAKSVGVTRQTIIAMEKGSYTPSVSLAIKLAGFFDVAVEEIFILTNK